MEVNATGTGAMMVYGEALEQLDRPIEQAVGLANAFYCDDAIATREKQTLFRDHWVCIAITFDVAEPGALVPVTVAGQPLIVVRGRDGQIRVFHNVCRHRGTKLASEACQGLRAITCPYHAWTYDLEGRLKATPRFDGSGDGDLCALDSATHSLVVVRSAIWNHLVFVNLSGTAPPLGDWLAPLTERWSAYALDQVRPGGEVHYDIAANWKLVLENFLESYHLPFVHKGLNNYSPLDDHEVAVTDLYMGQISHRYNPGDEAQGRLPRFPGLAEGRHDYAEYLLVFPSLMLSCAPDHYRVTIVTPLANGRTAQRWIFFFVGEAAHDPNLDLARSTLIKRVCDVTDEDIPILERLQQGRASEAYDGGRFSPHHEQTVHHFQRLVAASLAGGD